MNNTPPIKGGQTPKLKVSREAIAIKERIAFSLTKLMTVDPSEFDTRYKNILTLVDENIIDTYIKSCFWDPSKSHYCMMTSAGNFNVHPKIDAPRFFSRDYGKICNVAILETHFDTALDSGVPRIKGLSAGAYLKKLKSIAFEEISMHVRDERQRSMLEMRVDMFATKPHIELSRNTACLYFCHEPYVLSNNSKEFLSNLNEQEITAVIDEYKQHFPGLDNFLTMVVSARFAIDRKKAFVWLNADSDWGKGFMLGAFDALGVVVTTSVAEIEKAIEGSPIGKTMYDFQSCLILAVDEFKSVKSELKQLEGQIQLAPKNMLTQKVEVYTKLFMSAEGVDSLAGDNGVEDQFANRFSLLNYKGNMKTLKYFKQYGRAVYNACVQDYIATVLNRKIAKLVSLGRTKSTVIADDYLDKYHGENGIDKKYGRLSGKLSELAVSIITWAKTIYHESNGYKHEDTASIIGSYRHGEGEIMYCVHSTSVDKVIGDYIHHMVPHSSKATLSKKKAELKELMLLTPEEAAEAGLSERPRVCFGRSQKRTQKRVVWLKSDNSFDADDEENEKAVSNGYGEDEVELNKLPF
jgi:hypothetical protein